MGGASSNAARVDPHAARERHAPILTPRFFALSTVLVLLLLNAPLITGESALRKTDSESRSVRIHVVDAHDIRFVRLSTADGLSESVVQHVTQDDQGFVWFGTLNGLNRYDGYEFRVRKRGARYAPLSGTMITALFKDKAGHLWIGVDQSLNRFDPNTDTLTEYQHDPKNPTTIGGIVYGITQDRDGQIWIATSNGT
jgi:ligand-binding sensor domain-containing protein